MSQTRKLHAALAIAGAALAVSIVAAARGAGGAPAAGAACVDPEARAELAALRRALADRDALIARLGRAMPAPSGAAAPAAPADPAGSAARPAEPAEPGPRRYTHFESTNPAVSVTQRADGTYDIRATDPSLAGSVIEVTAVTAAGVEDRLFVRVP